jgi:metallophosphoesterase (TIGR00282 family)
MRLLYLGDIMGKPGRDVVVNEVPRLRRQLGLDFVVACGENAAHGYGITSAICQSLFTAGVDVVTTGNHAWDQREIVAYIAAEPRLLRPLNYPPETPGQGMGFYKAGDGRRVLVIQVMCRLYMEALDDPFRAVDELLNHHPLREAADAVILDIHGEATSEKGALGHLADGRVSMAVGSHSHIPTADTRILPGGTAFQTDAGMCGPYDSIIGMDKDVATQRFITKMRNERLEPAEGEGTLCGVYVETDDQTGLARRVEPIRVGGALRTALPF